MSGSWSAAQVTTLILSSGGVHGGAFIYALEKLAGWGLDWYTPARRVNIIHGCSVGGLVGALLALQHTPEELLEHLPALTLADKIQPTLRSLYTASIDDGSRLMQKMEEIFYAKCHRENITLGDLFKLSDTHLKLVACHVDEARYVVLDHLTAPNLTLAKACMMTMAVPVLFAAQQDFHAPNGGGPYIDGGVLLHYPVLNARADCSLGLYIDTGLSRKDIKEEGPLEYIMHLLSLISHTGTEAHWRELTESMRQNTIVFGFQRSGITFSEEGGSPTVRGVADGAIAAFIRSKSMKPPFSRTIGVQVGGSYL
jgi:predicted acylesterase/phospholipase RssA